MRFKVGDMVSAPDGHTSRRGLRGAYHRMSQHRIGVIVKTSEVTPLPTRYAWGPRNPDTVFHVMFFGEYDYSDPYRCGTWGKRHQARGFSRFARFDWGKSYANWNDLDDLRPLGVNILADPPTEDNKYSPGYRRRDYESEKDMLRKYDFCDIANIIARQPDKEVRESLALEFAQLLSDRNNPRFGVKDFVRACKPWGSTKQEKQVPWNKQGGPAVIS